MIICPNCKTENDEDAKFCKNCGYYFLEENSNNQNNNKKEHKKAPRYKQSSDKPKSSIFTKILLLFFILLSIGLLVIASILGYNYYLENNIEVPNVTGYTYEEATALLNTANLSYERKEQETTNKDEVGIVLKQSKKAGSKTHENAVITLTVGILDNHVTVPNVVGMALEEATGTLNKSGVSYRIEYKDTNDEEDNTVIKQSIKANKKIENTEIVTITVTRNNNNETDNNTNNDDETSNENKENSTSTDEVNQNQEKDLQN